ncbi:MAG: DUF2804 domain-containing protein [Oscillospiraceae bacterium]|nr:DUF2804 domain-containing protein [Oscillospiraceae bacterium]
MQHEIKKQTSLLDQNGNLTEPGFAKHMLFSYRRDDIKAPKALVKEWDYYYVGNDRYGVALTIADNGYMGLDSVTFLDFRERWQITKSQMRLLPLGRTGLPDTPDRDADTVSQGRQHSLSFRREKDRRILRFKMQRFQGEALIAGELILTQEPEESMVIATPFQKPGRFYLNQKINCMRAEGFVQVGPQYCEFRPEDTFAVLDWGRGVWTYHNTWYWSSLSAQLGGIPFGFNLGYGFGDTAAATENMLFFGGKAHKLGNVVFEIPARDGKADYLSPWKFHDGDHRLAMDFVPILDRAACTDFGVLKSDQHQVFGRFSGRAVLDDGTALSFRDLIGFAEQVENKW